MDGSEGTAVIGRSRQEGRRDEAREGRVKNRQIILVARPKAKLGPEHFRMSEGAALEPKEGEVLLRVHLISLDAANRA